MKKLISVLLAAMMLSCALATMASATGESAVIGDAAGVAKFARTVTISGNVPAGTEQVTAMLYKGDAATVPTGDDIIALTQFAPNDETGQFFVEPIPFRSDITSGDYTLKVGGSGIAAPASKAVKLVFLEVAKAAENTAVTVEAGKTVDITAENAYYTVGKEEALAAPTFTYAIAEGGESVAAVSEAGVISGVSEGSTTVKVTATSGAETSSVDIPVTVTAATATKTGSATIQSVASSMKNTGSITLTNDNIAATVTEGEGEPAQGTITAVNWSAVKKADDPGDVVPSIADGENGAKVLTATGTGTIVLTATVTIDGIAEPVTATQDIAVSAPVSAEVSITGINDTYDKTATVTLSDSNVTTTAGTITGVTWSVEGEGASIAENTLTFSAAGIITLKAEVTVDGADNSPVTATKQITVTESTTPPTPSKTIEVTSATQNKDAEEKWTNSITVAGKVIGWEAGDDLTFALIKGSVDSPVFQTELVSEATENQPAVYRITNALYLDQLIAQANGAEGTADVTFGEDGSFTHTFSFAWPSDLAEGATVDDYVVLVNMKGNQSEVQPARKSVSISRPGGTVTPDPEKVTDVKFADTVPATIQADQTIMLADNLVAVTTDKKTLTATTDYTVAYAIAEDGNTCGAAIADNSITFTGAGAFTLSATITLTDSAIVIEAPVTATITKEITVTARPTVTAAASITGVADSYDKATTSSITLSNANVSATIGDAAATVTAVEWSVTEGAASIESTTDGATLTFTGTGSVTLKASVTVEGADNNPVEATKTITVTETTITPVTASAEITGINDSYDKATTSSITLSNANINATINGSAATVTAVTWSAEGATVEGTTLTFTGTGTVTLKASVTVEGASNNPVEATKTITVTDSTPPVSTKSITLTSATQDKDAEDKPTNSITVAGKVNGWEAGDDLTFALIKGSVENPVFKTELLSESADGQPAVYRITNALYLDQLIAQAEGAAGTADVTFDSEGNFTHSFAFDWPEDLAEGTTSNEYVVLVNMKGNQALEQPARLGVTLARPGAVEEPEKVTAVQFTDNLVTSTRSDQPIELQSGLVSVVTSKKPLVEGTGFSVEYALSDVVGCGAKVENDKITFTGAGTFTLSATVTLTGDAAGLASNVPLTITRQITVTDAEPGAKRVVITSARQRDGENILDITGRVENTDTGDEVAIMVYMPKEGGDEAIEIDVSGNLINVAVLNQFTYATMTKNDTGEFVIAAKFSPNITPSGWKDADKTIPEKPYIVRANVTNGSATAGTMEVGLNPIKPQNPATEIVVSGADEVVHYAGETIQLSAAVTPTDATSTIRWTSNDPDLVSVDQTGKVTIKSSHAERDVTITAAATDAPGVFGTATIKVGKANVASVEITDEAKVLHTNSAKGDTSFTLPTPTVSLTDKSGQPLTAESMTAVNWTVEGNNGIVTLADGKVTAQAYGTVIVRATSVFDPTKSDTITVTVNTDPTGMKIAEGTQVAVPTGEEGLTLHLTVEPEGYVIESDVTAVTTNVAWTTSAEAVMTVTGGTVKAAADVTEGTATITATVAEGNPLYVADAETQVAAATEATLYNTETGIPVTGAELANATREVYNKLLTNGEYVTSVDLSKDLTIQPSNATDVTTTWTIDVEDNSVFTMNNGVLSWTGGAVGTVSGEVTVGSGEDAIRVPFEITLKPTVAGVKVENAPKKYDVGASVDLIEEFAKNYVVTEPAEVADAEYSFELINNEGGAFSIVEEEIDGVTHTMLKAAANPTSETAMLRVSVKTGDVVKTVDMDYTIGIREIIEVPDKVEQPVSRTINGFLDAGYAGRTVQIELFKDYTIAENTPIKPDLYTTLVDRFQLVGNEDGTVTTFSIKGLETYENYAMMVSTIGAIPTFIQIKAIDDIEFAGYEADKGLLVNTVAVPYRPTLGDVAAAVNSMDDGTSVAEQEGLDVINPTDLTAMRTALMGIWNGEAINKELYDLNRDGVVNSTDLVILLSNYNKNVYNTRIDWTPINRITVASAGGRNSSAVQLADFLPILPESLFDPNGLNDPNISVNILSGGAQVSTAAPIAPEAEAPVAAPEAEFAE